MNLVGSWRVHESDDHALADLGDVLLEFHEDGALTYLIRGADKDQVILLRYRIEGDTIVTDQPSAPQVERTAFSLSEDGVLMLAFGGVPYRFKRWQPDEAARNQDR
jgi:hypothetical protein